VEHVQSASYKNVDFAIEPCTGYNPLQDDYKVDFVAEFIPSDVNHAYLKICFTSDGWTQIVFERRNRILNRIGKMRLCREELYASGVELISISPFELNSFVSLVAQARLAIRPNLWFRIFGYGHLSAVIRHSDFELINPLLQKKWDWLKTMDESEFASAQPNLITFEPW
jgi:hypothetical protein